MYEYLLLSLRVEAINRVDHRSWGEIKYYLASCRERRTMEGEINNFVLVWSTVIVSLCYCHTVAKFIPSGTNMIRAAAILPVACLFMVLPLKLTSIHLGGVTGFFIGWLGSFKLILFALGTGPLATNPPLSLNRFVFLACLPIKAADEQQQQLGKKIGLIKSPVNYITKIMLMVVCIRAYEFTSSLHPSLVWFLYLVQIYFALDMMLAFIGATCRALLRMELEPQFDEPYLSTSIQDFWGRRWNLMVSRILRSTVYIPVRTAFAKSMGWEWALIPGIICSFLVSGLMHELIFYTFGRVKPTGELTSYFLLQGVSLAIEIRMKKIAARRNVRLPRIVSGPLALTYVLLTSSWLFFPSFLKCKGDLKSCTESIAFFQSLQQRRLVSPYNVTCPFFSS